jgi:hypothetical protein
MQSPCAHHVPHNTAQALCARGKGAVSRLTSRFLSGGTRFYRFVLSDQYVVGQRFDSRVGHSYFANILASLKACSRSIDLASY